MNLTQLRDRDIDYLLPWMQERSVADSEESRLRRTAFSLRASLSHPVFNGLSPRISYS